MTSPVPPKTDPWTWPEDVWHGAVDHIRAGRSLKPARWQARALPESLAATERS